MSDSAQPAASRLRILRHWLDRSARVWMERVRGGEYTLFLIVAAVIGVLGGLGAYAFEAAIHLVQLGSWNALEPAVTVLRETAPWKLALLPAIGGLVVGLITTFLVSEARGHGVPEVMKAVALHSGFIRGRVAIAKTLTSAITIGTGGSAGREGPIIQIGAAIGSKVGRILGVSPRRLRTLVGCGAAAGIAATFNAPIAGALFAVEVILGEFGATQFGPIVISSVLGTVVARGLRGNQPVFTAPAAALASPWELLPYIGLGVLCGLVSLAYIHLNHATGRLFQKGRVMPVWLRPALGGLLVGLMALALPHVMGDGHWLVNDAFAGKYTLKLLLLLVGAKILATCLTLGSGGSGGVFSPALAIGALLGASVGTLVAPWLGDAYGGLAAYALVGMAGLLAGSMLAPLTAILMAFEITSNYEIILPVMLVAILSTVLVSRLTGHLSIYTLPLSRSGIALFSGRSPDLLRRRHVHEFIRPVAETLTADLPARVLMDRMAAAEALQFYVTNVAGYLQGTITFADARRLLLSPPGLLDVLRADDLMRRDIPWVTPADTLSAALAKFATIRLHEIPVVRADDDPELLGVLSYSDVLTTYQEEILKSDAVGALTGGLAQLSRDPVTIAPGFQLAEWEPPAAYHGQTLAQARLPDTLGIRVLIIKRLQADGTLAALLPDARSVMTERDTLVLLGSSEAIGHVMGL
ncbi:MAG: CBS domain-containing protein [Lentisphaerae bacterium]|jgi:CIC family chloride channel protein|nr:CBS domain-containing protein [Lentisphaerota bacterium]